MTFHVSILMFLVSYPMWDSIIIIIIIIIIALQHTANWNTNKSR